MGCWGCWWLGREDLLDSNLSCLGRSWNVYHNKHFSPRGDAVRKRSRCCGEFAPLWSLEFPKSWFRIARPATHQHWLLGLEREHGNMLHWVHYTMGFRGFDVRPKFCSGNLSGTYLAKSVESHFSHLLPFVVGANQVGLGIGYRYGRSYSLSFAQITLELTVVVPTSAGGGAVSKGLQMVPDGFGTANPIRESHGLQFDSDTFRPTAHIEVY